MSSGGSIGIAAPQLNTTTTAAATPAAPIATPARTATPVMSTSAAPGIQALLQAKADNAARATQQNNAINDPSLSNRLTNMYGLNPSQGEKELVSGAKFGEAVIGPEGLGRLGTDPEMQGVLERLKSLSQGMSAPEEQARREQALREINTGSLSQQRALQAQLARAGVKGAAAGAQNTQVVNANIAARGNLEQQLMAQKSDMERRGLTDYSNVLGSTKTFDLSQAAKEKDIILQSALGERQLGEVNRQGLTQAQLAAQAAAEAAKAPPKTDIVKTVGNVAGKGLSTFNDAKNLLVNNTVKKLVPKGPSLKVGGASIKLW